MLANEDFGVDRSVISALLSHTPQDGAAITALYIRHAYLPEQRKALEAWGQHVLALAGGKVAGPNAANDSAPEDEAAA